MISKNLLTTVNGANSDYIYLNHDKLGLELSFDDIQYILKDLFMNIEGLGGYKTIEVKKSCIKLNKW